MAGHREVAGHERDSALVLGAQLLNDGVGSTTSLAFEVEELHERHPAVALWTEQVTVGADKEIRPRIRCGVLSSDCVRRDGPAPAALSARRPPTTTTSAVTTAADIFA
jgi:hypothetical protein